MVENPEFKELCRLCATKMATKRMASSAINIFEPEGTIRQISKKIRTCLPIQVHKTDKFPKNICGTCMIKLDLFYDFREHSARSERLFKELYKKFTTVHSDHQKRFRVPMDHNELVVQQYLILNEDSGLLTRLDQDENTIILTHDRVELNSIDSSDQDCSSQSFQTLESITIDSEPESNQDPLFTVDTVNVIQHHQLSDRFRLQQHDKDVNMVGVNSGNDMQLTLTVNDISDTEQQIQENDFELKIECDEIKLEDDNSLLVDSHLNNVQVHDSYNKEVDPIIGNLKQICDTEQQIQEDDFQVKIECDEIKLEDDNSLRVDSHLNNIQVHDSYNKEVDPIIENLKQEDTNSGLLVNEQPNSVSVLKSNIFGKKYEQKSKVHGHSKTHLYKCETCLTVFMNADILSSHRKEAHGPCGKDTKETIMEIDWDTDFDLQNKGNTTLTIAMDMDMNLENETNKTMSNIKKNTLYDYRKGKKTKINMSRKINRYIGCIKRKKGCNKISKHKYDKRAKSLSSNMQYAVKEAIPKRMRLSRAYKASNVFSVSGITPETLSGITPETLNTGVRGNYRRKVFNEVQQKALTNIIQFMEKRFFLLSTTDLRRLAFEFAVKHKVQHNFDEDSKLAGSFWLSSFLKCRNVLRTNVLRPIGFNRLSVTAFFSLLSAECEKYNFSPDRIWNVDATVINTSASRIFPLKGSKHIEKEISANKGNLITVEVCMSAAGSFMPLTFVFPSKKVNPELLNQAPPGSFAEYHESGWMQREIFSKWFKRFIDFVNPSAERPVLLLLDADTTYAKSLELIDLARENHVIILCFPAYCTHRLQPLDHVFVDHMNPYYLQEVKNWQLHHYGQSVTINDAAKLYQAVFNKVATKQRALDRFRKTGIYPLNPNHFHNSTFGPYESTSIQLSCPVNENSALLIPDCLPSTSFHTESLNHMR